MTRRRLTPEEQQLWRSIARTTTQMNSSRKTDPVEIPKAPKAEKPRHRIGAFEFGQKSRNARSVNEVAQPYDTLPPQPLNMSKREYARLKRGKMIPEARIDLHGMTVDQAHGSLVAFVMRAQAEGKRLVLVITGKGKKRDDGGPIPVRQGVLRHNVPHWLSVPPLAQIVLQVKEAHARHGGGGAYYVYLRRNR